jgi:hypothetical protein
LNKEDWLVVTETCDMLLQMRANMVLSQSAAIQSSVSGQGLASFLEPYSASVLLRLTTFLRVDLVNTSKWMPKGQCGSKQVVQAIRQVQRRWLRVLESCLPANIFVNYWWAKVEDRKV